MKETFNSELRQAATVNVITGERQTVAKFQRVRIVHKDNGTEHENSRYCQCGPIVVDEAP